MRNNEVRPMRGIACLAGLLLATSAVGQAPKLEAWKAPGYAARKKNPVAAATAAVQSGKALFVSLCAACHGNDGKGDGPAAAALKPPPRDLTHGDWHHQTDGSLFWKIRTGRAPMPAFAAAMTAEQTWQVVHFLRAIQPKDATVASRVAKHATTDATRRQVSATLSHYVEMRDALSSGSAAKLTAARKRWQNAADKLAKPGPKLKGPALQQWQRGAKALRADLNKPAADAATELQQLAGHVAKLLAGYGHAESKPVWLFRWPQARKGAGGQWLQLTPVASTPFSAAKNRKQGVAAAMYPPVKKRMNQGGS